MHSGQNAPRVVCCALLLVLACMFNGAPARAAHPLFDRAATWRAHTVYNNLSRNLPPPCVYIVIPLNLVARCSWVQLAASLGAWAAARARRLSARAPAAASVLLVHIQRRLHSPRSLLTPLHRPKTRNRPRSAPRLDPLKHGRHAFPWPQGRGHACIRPPRTHRARRAPDRAPHGAAPSRRRAPLGL